MSLTYKEACSLLDEAYLIEDVEQIYLSSTAFNYVHLKPLPKEVKEILKREVKVVKNRITKKEAFEALAGFMNECEIRNVNEAKCIITLSRFIEQQYDIDDIQSYENQDVECIRCEGSL